MARSSFEAPPFEQHGWTVFFHPIFIAQLGELAGATERARRADPEGFPANSNVKLFAAVTRLVTDTVPSDPTRAEYRLGGSLGPRYRNWFRVRFGGRFRLFFRYDSRVRIIVFAWMNDASTLRQRGARSDPYQVFRAMLDRGDPPDDWNALLRAARNPEEFG